MITCGVPGFYETLNVILITSVILCFYYVLIRTLALPDKIIKPFTSKGQLDPNPEDLQTCQTKPKAMITEMKALE